MRLYGIETDHSFKEFVRKSFDIEHEEVTLEEWLEGNPDQIVEDTRLLIIGRQVTTNLGGFIDLLAIDRQGNIVIVELKRGKTPRDVIAQALEYASFVDRLDWKHIQNLLRAYLGDESIELTDYHRKYFGLSDDEAVSFNKEQRLVIVGQNITEPIRQTAEYLGMKGIPVTCVQFSFFESGDGRQLMSEELVAGLTGGASTTVTTASLPKTTESRFISELDEFGRQVFEPILDLAKKGDYPLNWGTRGFTLNVRLESGLAAILYGYPPDSVYKQSLYTGLVGPNGGLVGKIGGSEETADELFLIANQTGLFTPAGKEVKCIIDRAWTDTEIQKLLDWIQSVASFAQGHELEG